MNEGFQKLNVKTIDEQRLLKIESQLIAINKAIKEAERNDGDSLLDKSINEINSIIGEITKIPEDPSYSHNNNGDSLLDKSMNEINSTIVESTKIPEDPNYSHDVEQLKHLKNELLKAEANLKEKINTENKANILEKEEVLIEKNN